MKYYVVRLSTREANFLEEQCENPREVLERVCRTYIHELAAEYGLGGRLE